MSLALCQIGGVETYLKIDFVAVFAILKLQLTLNLVLREKQKKRKEGKEVGSEKRDYFNTVAAVFLPIF